MREVKKTCTKMPDISMEFGVTLTVTSKNYTRTANHVAALETQPPPVWLISAGP